MVLIGMGTYGLYAILAGCEVEVQRSGLLVCGFVVFVLYFLQRFFMFRDPEFLEQFGSKSRERLVQWLPLQVCYSGLILTMVGLYYCNDPLEAFGFYVGWLGAFMAMLTPDKYYKNKNVFHPPVLLLYLTHGLLMVFYSCICLLGFFQLSWNAGIRSVCILILLTLGLHIINLVGHRRGLTTMNYGYTMSPEGSFLLEMAWKWIPYRYLYVLVPGSLFFGAWTIIVNAIYYLWKI